MTARAWIPAVTVGSLTVLSVLGALFAGGCAKDISSAAEELDGASDADAGSDSEGDASVSVEAGSDADVDAAAKACSVDAYCYTALPPNLTLRGVWGDGLGAAWAVSEQGSILRWNGTSWSIAHTVDGGLFAIWGSGPTDLWAGGVGGLFHGSGASANAIVWAAVPIAGDAGAAIQSIWGTGPSNVWAVGRKPSPYGEARVGRVLHLEGAGQDWSLDPISSRPTAFIEVWGTGPTDVWIGADKSKGSQEEGVVYRRAGALWTEVALPTDPESYAGKLAIFTSGGATTADDVWVFGRSEETLPTAWRGTRRSGGDFEWTVQTTRFSDKFVWGIWGTSRDDAWSAGEYGRLRHWDGSEWTQARITVTEYPFTRTFHGAWGDGKGELWFVGEDVALHKAVSK